MNSALMREYAERTLESKTSLDILKLKEGEILEPTKAFSVRSLISVFGFGRNFSWYASFWLFFFRLVFWFLIGPYVPLREQTWLPVSFSLERHDQ